MIGPLEPKGWLARLLATTWMLFPKDEEYRTWMMEAGFKDVKVRYTSPHWVSSREKYGIAIVGKKPLDVSSHEMMIPSILIPKEEENHGIFRTLILIWRVVIGSLAGFLFIPVALTGYLLSAGSQRDTPPEYRERLNGYQITAILFILALVVALVWYFMK
jgi:MPBQ/MSBQ methyltransferase